jgi:DNA-binding NarL/FixJ family response regulator
MNYQFDKYGLIDPTQLRLAIDVYLETHGKLSSSERMQSVIRSYINGQSIEEIAKSMNVTRERIRQILAKVQRKLGVKSPLAEEHIYGALTLEEWKDMKQMDNLEENIRTHLKVYGVKEEDIESLTRLIFISLRGWFQDKSFMYESEEL